MNLLPHPDEVYEMSLADDIAEDPYSDITIWNDMAKKEREVLGEYSEDQYLIVMPSVRRIPWEYFKTLSQFAFFICDDSDGKADRQGLKPGQWNEYSYLHIVDGMESDVIYFPKVFLADREFTTSYVGEENLWLFPNHNPSVKNIGLYFAVKEGYKAVILLDDDVDCRERTMRDFMTIKRPVSTWSWRGTGDWVNTLSLISNNHFKERLFARGFPYEYRSGGFVVKKDDRYGSGLAYPFFNEGLWVGHPDINGVDKFELEPNYRGDEMDSELPWYIDTETEVTPGQVLLRAGQKLPLSIMNCQIDAALIPAFYQPSDFTVYNTYRIRRHDDIWSMYFLRAIMEHLGADITVGEPLVNHRKRANVVGELLSEHNTNLIQPYFCDVIDQAAEKGYNRYYGEEWSDIRVDQVALMSNELSASIRVFSDWEYVPGDWQYILQSHFKNVQGWAKLFIP